MKLKKLLTFTTSLILSTSMMVGCSNKGNESSSGNSSNVIKIGMVTDTGGVNDESFNQSAWEGLQRLKKEYGDKVNVKYLESKQDADYTPNVETFVDEEMDLIIGVGYKLENAIKEASKNYPDNNFAIIDTQVDAKNVDSLLFADNESSYLTGLIAGKMTKTGKVGFIGGMESEVISKFEYGYKAGVLDSNPEAKISTQYTNSYTDSALGKSIANQMHTDGVDVIFTAAGACGTGAIEAAKENNKMAIGVDQDQNKLAPKNVITSAMKNVDVTVYNISKDLLEGKYEGGKVIVSTLETEGVGIAPTTKDNVPQDILDYVNEIKNKVKYGDIKVPATKDEFEKTYPNNK
ncbi:BMP family lipoprotein [Romboutsia sp. 1001713B170207_170306_H8]|uniref:BMP family lipoprotein n=1 Tax=Romboutsia sp. 1001713B170207_170306_H8 TaxID=2787112 RepID=UPI001899A71B|nr:BMP family ABC transporter substrate-binding protein [Romboutsia sp. 1001713B170207_170306_H8]